jgi:hypothetical protein
MIIHFEYVTHVALHLLKPPGDARASHKGMGRSEQEQTHGASGAKASEAVCAQPLNEKGCRLSKRLSTQTRRRCPNAWLPARSRSATCYSADLTMTMRAA